MKRALALTSLAGAALFSVQAQAVDLTIGLGAAIAPDYEGSDEYEAVPLWNLRAGNLYDPNTYVQILGPTLKSNFIPHPNWRLGLSGQFKGERGDVENDAVDDMRDTDSGLMLGLVGGYDFILGEGRVAGLELNGRYDVDDQIGGLVTASAKYRMPIAGTKMLFNTDLSTTYASEDYMSEFFGVTGADAARSGLDQYNADADLKDVALTGGVTYKISDSFSATLTARYSRLLSDAEDSPVVDDEGDENQFFGGILVNYTF